MVLFFQRGTAFPKKKGKLEAFEKKMSRKTQKQQFYKSGAAKFNRNLLNKTR